MMIGVIIFLLGVYFVWDYKADLSHKCFHKRDNALEIVKERYARGEISQEEYLTMKTTLMG